MRLCFAALFLAVFPAQEAVAEDLKTRTDCDRLVALYIELAEKSGSSVSEAEARAEVMSTNPTQDECAAMLALFEARR